MYVFLPYFLNVVGRRNSTQFGNTTVLIAVVNACDHVEFCRGLRLSRCLAFYENAHQQRCEVFCEEVLFFVKLRFELLGDCSSQDLHTCAVSAQKIWNRNFTNPNQNCSRIDCLRSWRVAWKCIGRATWLYELRWREEILGSAVRCLYNSLRVAPCGVRAMEGGNCLWHGNRTGAVSNRRDLPNSAA